jgi:hypothetical protein
LGSDNQPTGKGEYIPKLRRIPKDSDQWQARREGGAETMMIGDWWPGAVLAIGLVLIVYGQGSGETPVVITGAAAALIGAFVMVARRNQRGL